MNATNFIDEYGTLNGIALANRLGINGKGCKAIANAISAYQWNVYTFQRSGVKMYDDIAKHCLKEIPSEHLEHVH